MTAAVRRARIWILGAALAGAGAAARITEGYQLGSANDASNVLFALSGLVVACALLRLILRWIFPPPRG